MNLVAGLVAIITQFYYCYLACFKPWGLTTFSCSLTARENVFYCAITATVSIEIFTSHS